MNRLPPPPPSFNHVGVWLPITVAVDGEADRERVAHIVALMRRDRATAEAAGWVAIAEGVTLEVARYRKQRDGAVRVRVGYWL